MFKKKRREIDITLSFALGLPIILQRLYSVTLPVCVELCSKLSGHICRPDTNESIYTISTNLMTTNLPKSLLRNHLLSKQNGSLDLTKSTHKTLNLGHGQMKKSSRSNEEIPKGLQRSSSICCIGVPLDFLVYTSMLQ